MLKLELHSLTVQDGQKADIFAFGLTLLEMALPYFCWTTWTKNSKFDKLFGYGLVEGAESSSGQISSYIEEALQEFLINCPSNTPNEVLVAAFWFLKKEPSERPTAAEAHSVLSAIAGNRNATIDRASYRKASHDVDQLIRENLRFAAAAKRESDMMKSFSFSRGNFSCNFDRLDLVSPFEI